MSLFGYASIMKRPVEEAVKQVLLGIALREPISITFDELLDEVRPLAPYRVGATMAEVKRRLTRDLGYQEDVHRRLYIRSAWRAMDRKFDDAILDALKYGTGMYDVKMGIKQ